LPTNLYIEPKVGTNAEENNKLKQILTMYLNL